MGLSLPDLVNVCEEEGDCFCLVFVGLPNQAVLAS